MTKMNICSPALSHVALVIVFMNWNVSRVLCSSSSDMNAIELAAYESCDRKQGDTEQLCRVIPKFSFALGDSVGSCERVSCGIWLKPLQISLSGKVTKETKGSNGDAIWHRSSVCSQV